MIHFKFTKKNVRRLCVTMALIAPFVYLFGSLFTYLAGAHGNFIVNDESYVTYSDEYTEELSFIESDDDPFPVDYFALDVLYGSTLRVDGSLVSATSSSLSAYLDGEVVYSSSLPDVSLRSAGSFRDSLDSSGILTRNTGVLLGSAVSLSSVSKNDSNPDSYLYYFSHSYRASYASDVICNLLPTISPYPLNSAGCAVVPNSDVVYFNLKGLINDNDVSHAWQWLSDSGVVFYFGSSPRTSDVRGFSSSFSGSFDNLVFDSSVAQPALFSSYLNYSVVSDSNNDYLFGQFFARDNFVSEIGKDALSDDPHGFVPFASMLRFVDDNMLNIGSLQVGLMAYGYFYWCAHVLLLMVLFDLTTFFITWVSHIGDKFGGNADE